MVAGGFAVIVGLLAFAGWFADVPRLTDWDGDGISMFPNTALGAILAGLALILVARRGAREGPGPVAALGAAVLLVGGLTVFEHLASIDLGIDTLIVSKPWGQSAASAPMRMGLPASISFILLGAAIVLADVGRRRAASITGLSALFIPTLSLTAYLLGASTLYAIPRYTGIALQTAVVLVVLALGIVASITEHGLAALMRRDDPAGVVVRRILPLGTLIILATGWFRLVGQDAGLYDSAFGAAIRSVVLIFTFLGLLWWAARAIIRQIEAREAADAQRLAIVQSSADAIYTFDLDGKVRSWNPAAEQLYGFPADEMVGRNVEILIPPRLREQMRELMATVVREGRPVHQLETVRVRGDGTEFDALLTVSPIKSPSGETAMLSVIARDISERKRVELELRQNRDRFDIVREGARVGFWFCDLPFDKLIWDDRVKEHFWLPHDAEVTIDTFYSCLHPDDRERTRKAIEGSIANRTPYEIDYRTVSPDGQVKWLRANGRTFYDDEGEPVRFDGVTIDITARVLAEEAVALNQRMFSDLVERSPYGVYIVDSDFRLAVLNKGSLEGAFVNVRPAVGRDFAEAMRIVWPEPLATQLIGIFRRTLETGEPYYSRDFVSPRGDTEQVESYEWELHRIDMPDGRHGVVCYYYDSTALRQTEIALREQQRFTQSIIEAAPSLTYIFDIGSGRNVFISSQVKEVLGYTQEEIARMGSGLLGTLLHPDDQQKAADRFNRIMASETDGPFAIDYRMRHRDGHWVWLDDRARIFKRGDHGMPTQILAVTSDITERKEFEQRVAESEERFRRASDAARALVYDVDLTGTRPVVAHGIERVTGFRAEDSDLSSAWWHSLLHPDDVDAHAANYRRFLETGGSYRTSYRVRRSDGREIWVEDTAQVTKDETGRPARVIGTIVDVTERRLAEEELRRSNEREKAARVEAEQANRAKDEFLAVLSHELRTPLHSIKGWISLLRGGSLDQQQQRQGLDVIARNVEAQNALIEDILDVSRIVLGKLSLERETVSLSAVVRDAVDAMRPVAEAAGIRLAADITDDRAESDADPFRIRQIVSNLVGNAVKFTPYGGSVTVRFDSDGARARLTVSDTGVGIAADVLPRVFDRFEQADGSRRRKYAGLGLGLAIVKHLAELHGGMIAAESSGENLGATFTVELPLRKAARSPQPTNGNAAADNGKPLAGVAILIVDDDPDALDMLEVSLQAAGAETAAVQSGDEAVDCLKQRKFDFLLSDLGMPGMDGFDLIRVVRDELSISPREMPAMALSGYAGVEDRERAMISGYQHHSAKPVDLNSLPGLILSIVSSNGRAEAVRVDH
jgi:PAS domain S-box-containing protein